MSEVKDKELKEAEATGGCSGFEIRETGKTCGCGAPVVEQYLNGQYMGTYCGNGHRLKKILDDWI